MAWTIEFYVDRSGGRAPVREFIETLPKKHRAKALAIVKRLEESGTGLPFPYASHVRGKIFELRTRLGRDRIRILYFADTRRWFILLNALIKRTEKLDEQDVRIAENRMDLHLAWLRSRKGGLQ